MNQFSTTCRAINSSNLNRPRILSFSVHEGYQYELAKINAEFLHIPGTEGKRWDEEYRDMPQNVIEIEGEQLETIPYVDICLSHTVPQRQLAAQICKNLCIPHITLHHIYPNENLPQRTINEMRETSNVDCTVFTTQDAMKQWGYDDSNSEIIEHGVDTDKFSGWSPTDPRILSVANFYDERGGELGFDKYMALVNGFGKDKFFHLGKSNTGFSTPQTKEDPIENFYKRHMLFINTANRSVLPTTLIEAMSTGMPVVTTRNPTIDTLIKNGENGFATDDINEFAKYISILMSDKELREKIGFNARKDVCERYNIDRFTYDWENIFRKYMVK